MRTTTRHSLPAVRALWLLDIAAEREPSLACNTTQYDVVPATEPQEIPEMSTPALPPPTAYRPPCTIDTCACAWVPHHVGDTWYVVRACGSTRIVVTPARFTLPRDQHPLERRAVEMAVRLNRLYGRRD